MRRTLIALAFLLTFNRDTYAQATNPAPQVQSLYDAYTNAVSSASAGVLQLANLQNTYNTLQTTHSQDLSTIANQASQISTLTAQVGAVSAPITINFYVDSIGADTNAGTITSPFKTIQHAITVSSQSKPVIFAFPGDYNEHLIFKGYEDLRGVYNQTIVDGKNTLPVLAEGGQHVSIRGIRFTGANSPSLNGAVKPNNYWLIENCEIDHNSQAATDTHGTQSTHVHDVTLRNVLADHNGAEGFKGGWCDNVVEDRCESSTNNTSSVNVLNEAGGGKYLQTNGCKFLNCYYHDNIGPGLWLDFNNANAVVDGLYTSGNKGPSGMGIGAVIEISQGPITVIRYHGSGNGDSDLGIFESTNVTVQDSRMNAYLRDNNGRQDNNGNPIHIKNIAFVNCVGGIPKADTTKNVTVK